MKHYDTKEAATYLARHAAIDHASAEFALRILNCYHVCCGATAAHEAGVADLEVESLRERHPDVLRSAGPLQIHPLDEAELIWREGDDLTAVDVVVLLCALRRYETTIGQGDSDAWMNTLGATLDWLVARTDSNTIAWAEPYRGAIADLQRGSYLRSAIQLAVAANAANLAEDPTGQIVALSALGLLHHRLGNLEGARRRLLSSIARIDEHLGPEHAEGARVRLNLSVVLEDDGRLEEAARSAEQAVDIAEAAGAEEVAREATRIYSRLLVQLGRDAEVDAPVYAELQAGGKAMVVRGDPSRVVWYGGRGVGGFAATDRDALAVQLACRLGLGDPQLDKVRIRSEQVTGEIRPTLGGWDVVVERHATTGHRTREAELCTGSLSDAVASILWRMLNG